MKLEQAARQALEALETLDCGDSYKTHNAAANLREALAEPQITTPDVCGEVCARAKLCYGCNKDLEEANAKYVEQAEQEPTGYLYEYKSSGEIFSGVFTDDFDAIAFNCGYNIRPLYAAPVRTKDLTDDYYELIHAVGSKFPNESRHETALRYIRQAERGDNQARAVIAADREKNK